MANHPRAGQPAQPEDLTDIDALLEAYTQIVPDPDTIDQQVAFGTSGHRGSSLDVRGPVDRQVQRQLARRRVQRAPHPGHDAGDL